MDPSKILGILCRKCNKLIDLNDKNHKCSATTAQAQFKFQKLQPKMSSSVSSYSPMPSTVTKPSLISNFLNEIEQEEQSDTSSLSENNSDDDDNEFYTNLITEVNERNPLWDHRLPMSARYEPIKQNLWNEIYVALKGIYPIDVLKKKWKYLREKYVREKRKPASGAAG
ncbi:uncharacterized protein LOC132945439, partial [Metopolophium dirhodum]|uniref:uncharacterized protein LOC132945439 n=1 Tax=Metopolophium dirhodum TaxID=44670 RepID=UPI00298F4B69